MPAVLKFLTRPLARPSLGSGAASIASIYVWLFVAATSMRRDSPLQLLVGVAPFLILWISLSVLLRVRNPPETVSGSIIFALLLLNFVVGLGFSMLVIISGLCS